MYMVHALSQAYSGSFPRLIVHSSLRMAASQIRSSHDGARPPPIPAFLLDLVQRCMSDAQAAPGVGALPPLKPNICLCNFYEKQGKLGLHQVGTF